jgi:hypothetical protein
MNQETDQLSSLHAMTGQALADRICVSPPYFALRNLHWGSQLLASAVAEANPHGERGPMTAAEIGRHAAIAGLSSIALSQPTSRRHYYLAQGARCRFFPSDRPFGTEVDFMATPGPLQPRKVTASIKAVIGETLLAECEVDYALLRDDLFARLFAKRKLDDALVQGHHREPLPLRMLSTSRGVIDAVPRSACAGHFAGYPALPVAVLTGNFVHLAARSLNISRYRIASADVEADALAWADEEVTLDVAVTDESAGDVIFECTAHSGSQRIGRMRLGLCPG